MRATRRRSLWVTVVVFAVLLAGCGGSHVVKGPYVSIETSPMEIEVPNVMGKTSRNAVGELHTDGFSVRERRRAVGHSRTGIVIAQHPGHGDFVNTGSVVTITLGR
jgi:beta-lactam-binding protein with PASTA domain